jgi:hypothetical protein
VLCSISLKSVFLKEAAFAAAHGFIKATRTLCSRTRNSVALESRTGDTQLIAKLVHACSMETWSKSTDTSSRAPAIRYYKRMQYVTNASELLLYGDTELYRWCTKQIPRRSSHKLLAMRAIISRRYAMKSAFERHKPLRCGGHCMQQYARRHDNHPT